MILNDISYNGITLSRFVRGSGYMAEMVQGNKIGIRDTIDPLPGIDGVERYKSFYGDRLIEIRGFIKGLSETDLYDKKLAIENAFDIRILEESVAGTDGFLPLEFTETGQSAVRIYCKPIRQTLTINENRRGLALPFAVLLEAKDPTKYLTTEETLTLTPETTSGSSDLPFTLPVVLSGSTYSATGSITNTGSVAVLPSLIRIDGECTAPSITNTTTGETISFTGDLQLLSGDYLLITPSSGECTIYRSAGGTENAIAYWVTGSEFWNIETGANSILFTASSMASGAEATITVRLSQ